MFTAPAFVPATFHDTVAVLEPFAVQVVFIFWDVILKPELFTTVTIISSEQIAAAPLLLSLVVNLKFIVRALGGNISPMVVVPSIISWSLGKSLVGVNFGTKLLNKGLLPEFQFPAVPKSYCSQL